MLKNQPKTKITSTKITIDPRQKAREEGGRSVVTFVSALTVERLDVETDRLVATVAKLFHRFGNEKKVTMIFAEPFLLGSATKKE